MALDCANKGGRKGSIERGLCLFREQLQEAATQPAVKFGGVGALLADIEGRTVLGREAPEYAAVEAPIIAEPVDPQVRYTITNRYAANNLALEAEIAVKQAAKDAGRAGKLAVLGETLRQKVEARYPHEDRSDRVYERQNPRFK